MGDHSITDPSVLEQSPGVLLSHAGGELYLLYHRIFQFTRLFPFIKFPRSFFSVQKHIIITCAQSFFHSTAFKHLAQLPSTNIQLSTEKDMEVIIIGTLQSGQIIGNL